MCGKQTWADSGGTQILLVRFSQVNLEAETFRKRAIQCRDVAKCTKDLEAQRELRALAKDLDSEADMIERESKAI
jgi:hypothetical protein